MAAGRLWYISSILILGSCAVVLAQNSGPGIPRGIQECYYNDTLYARPLRIPSTIGALAALIDRVERIPGLNMDLRTLSGSLVHRFRTDGVERDPTVMVNSGVIPFTTSGFQNFRYRLFIEKLLPGNANSFPNASLTGEERCALHFMFSTTVDRWERRDEGSVCSRLQNFRSFRAPRDAQDEDERIVDLVSQEDEVILGDRRAAKQYEYPPESQCPIEDGVVWTPWGSIGASALMAGIAAGLQPQDVSVNQMGFQPRSGGENILATLENLGPVNNLYAATFSGDLGEVVLRQGPRYSGQMNIGGPGGWNDTAMPKHYFLAKNDNYEMSDAEIRGGLDGLILGFALPELQSTLGNRITLSQAIDMFYSERGFPTQRTARACQRREHVSKVAPNDKLVSQTRNLIPALQHYMSAHVIKDEVMEQYINNAVSRLLSYIPSMNDKACEVQAEAPVATDRLATPALDLFIVVDPTWNYDDALPTLAALLREIPPHAAGSSLTLKVGSQNEIAMINFTRSILDFYGNFTAENYRMFMSTQLDVAKSLAQLRSVFAARREEEKRLDIAGGRAQAALFIAHTATGASDEQSKLYLQNEARVFRESNPDVRLLFLCSGNKERFKDVVIDPERDLFTLAPPGFTGTPDVKDVVKRLSELHARFINPTCGAKWSGNDNNNGGGQQVNMYADPTGIKYFRLMPNYFFHSDKVTVKFQGQGQGRINVCYSRSKEMPQSSGDPGQGGTSTGGVTCRQISSDSSEFRVERPCNGAHYAIDCKPLYFSAVAVESSNRCVTASNQEDGCRYPDLVRFVVTSEGLGCHSDAGLPSAMSFILLVASSLFVLLQKS